MDLGLKGKVAIITGSGSGIGRQIALNLAKEGANVVINDLEEGKIKSVANEVRSHGVKALEAKVDITNWEAVKSMVDNTLKEFGQIDILVNNAGVGAYGLFADLDRKTWNPDINVNVFGVLNCCKAVIPNMIERKYGKIVSIGSDAGRVGEPYFAVYSGAKAFIIGFSKALAKELGRYMINVNVVCPGTTKTPLVELLVSNEEVVKKMLKAYAIRRLGEPEDIANAVTFLVSDVTSWVTGQTLSVSGGYSMI
ncbi:MAG: SDR family NAD(P)-dependent oxidoreductase [Candidatus Jordarchaeum sp.]|uniref:SDR family NAD(P)-dependent oxidoreductase n=1 Tax=Candidatus Jordarchaeum sp. TaxID=2823881 RepID=UPI00404AC2E2